MPKPDYQATDQPTSPGPYDVAIKANNDDLGSGALMETAMAVSGGEAMSVDNVGYGALLAGALAGRNAVEKVDEEERGPQDVKDAHRAAQSRDGG